MKWLFADEKWQLSGKSGISHIRQVTISSWSGSVPIVAMVPQTRGPWPCGDAPCGAAREGIGYHDGRSTTCSLARGAGAAVEGPVLPAY